MPVYEFNGDIAVTATIFAASEEDARTIFQTALMNLPDPVIVGGEMFIGVDPEWLEVEEAEIHEPD